MAINYINSLRSVITGHNQQLSDFMVDLIAWSGLEETNAYTNWKNSMPYGPSLSPESIQGAMNTFFASSSNDCGNGLPLMCSLPGMCQSETGGDSIQKYINCLDSYVRATSQEFDLPDASEEFLVKKLIVTLYLKKGDLVADSCIDTFTKAKERRVRKGQKIVRVYEYFLEGPGKYPRREEKQKLVKNHYNQEVEKELKKLKRGGNILNISYNLISVGYPKF